MVGGMPEEELTKLQEKILDLERRLRDVEELLKQSRAAEGEKEEPLAGFPNLAKRTGIEDRKLREIFDLEGDKLTVVRNSGKDNKERTQSIALLTLLGYKYLLGTEEVLSQEIRRNVAENGIPLDDYSKHLNEITPSLMRRKGRTKSPKTSYRLTTLGAVRTREIVKNLPE